MARSKRAWLAKHGELSFCADQGVCVRVFWETKYTRAYFNTHCNGETMGIDRIYEQLRDRLFSMCNNEE